MLPMWQRAKTGGAVSGVARKRRLSQIVEPEIEPIVEPVAVQSHENGNDHTDNNRHAHQVQPETVLEYDGKAKVDGPMPQQKQVELTQVVDNLSDNKLDIV